MVFLYYRHLLCPLTGIVTGAVLGVSYLINSFLGLAVIAAAITITGRNKCDVVYETPYPPHM